MFVHSACSVPKLVPQQQSCALWKILTVPGKRTLSGGERWEGDVLEQRRTNALATDVACFKNKEGKQCKIDFSLISPLPLLDVISEGINVFTIKNILQLSRRWL